MTSRSEAPRTRRVLPLRSTAAIVATAAFLGATPTPGAAAKVYVARLGGQCLKADLGSVTSGLRCAHLTKGLYRWVADVTYTAPLHEPEPALTVLGRIAVELEHPTGYVRAAFPTWPDLDGSGCATDVDVKRRDSTIALNNDPACVVDGGSWTSSYDGRTGNDSKQFDVDHVVALKEAWDSGAWAWSAEERAAYANDTSDPRTLRTVSATSNRSKGDADPSNWIPQQNVCGYLGDWISIKARWGLSMDQSEHGRINNLIERQCPDLTVRLADLPPLAGPTVAIEVNPPGESTLPTTAPATTIAVPVVTTVAPPANTVSVTPRPLVGAVTPTPSSAPTTTAAGAVFFKNCDEARAAGVAPLRRGDPGYRPALDGDKDGVACEVK